MARGYCIILFNLINTDFITGHEIETIGLVKGSTVYSKNVVRDVFARLNRAQKSVHSPMGLFNFPEGV